MDTERDRLLANGRIDFQKRAIEASVWQCCLNCEHWSPLVKTGFQVVDGVRVEYTDHSHQCGKWLIKPPAEVVAVGCPDWQHMIPF